MTDIVARLRNWRSVHLARLHILMEQAADEMERLSRYGDCPEPDNCTNEDTVGRTLARRITGLQSTLEVAKLQEEVRRLEGVIAASQPTLTDAERAAVSIMADIANDPRGVAKHHGLDLAATLRCLLERLGDTPTAHTTPREGSKQNGCTLTDAEREAVTTAMNAYADDNADPECAAIEATLWGLLERMR